MRILAILLLLISGLKDKEHIEDLFKRASKWRVGSAVTEVESARDTIRELGDSVILYLLNKHIKTDRTLELRALKSIMKGKHTLYMKALRDYINHPNDTIRLSAIYLVGELKDSGSIPYLLKAVRDTSLRVKLNAMLSLGKVGDTAFGQVLCKELKESSKEKVKIVALRSIADMKYGGCVEEVINRLSDERSVVKYAALNALSKIGKDAFRAIVKGFQGKLGFYEIYALLGIVENDSSLTTEDTVIARSIFTRAFKDNDPAKRILAVRGMCRVLNKRGKEILSNWLFYERSVDVRYEIKRCVDHE